jgi:hypothetical protein
MKFSRAVVACTATAVAAVTASAAIPALAANGSGAARPEAAVTPNRRPRNLPNRWSLRAARDVVRRLPSEDTVRR